MKKEYLITISLLAVIIGVFAGLSWSGPAAADISDTSYKATIKITNNGTAATGVSVNLSLNTEGYINAGLFNEDASGLSIVDSAGTETAFMPGANSSLPLVFWIPSVIGNGIQYDILYSQATGGKYAYFPGDGGMTISDNASMEPGDRFTKTISCYLDTTNTGNITDKEGALWLEVPEAGTITANTGDNKTLTLTDVDSGDYEVVTSLDMYYGGDKLPDPSDLPASTGRGVAFSSDDTYMAVAHASSPYVTIYKRSGDTFTKLADPSDLPAGNGYGVAFSSDDTYMAVAHAFSPYVTIYKQTIEKFSLDIYEDGSLKYSDSIITGVSTQDDFEWGSDGDSLATSGGDITWSVTADGTSRAEIDTAQAYAGTRSARLYRDGTNSPPAAFSQTALTPNEVLCIPAMKDDTSRYVVYHGNGTYRITVVAFETEVLYYYDGAYKDTGETVSVDTWFLLEIRNVDWNSGTYDIYLDGSLAQSGATMEVTSANANIIRIINTTGTSECWIDDVQVSIPAISIPDTDADWVIGDPDVTPYINYWELDVDGEQVCYIDWEYGDTFYDSSGYDNDAVPTFRTTSSDAYVSAEIISFEPYAPATAGTVSANFTGYIVTDVPEEPETLYTEGTPDFFLAPFITEMLALGNVPPFFFWSTAAFMITIVVGILVFAVSKSLLLKAIVMFSLMLAFSLPGVNIYGTFAAILFAFFALADLLLSKHYGW